MLLKKELHLFKQNFSVTREDIPIDTERVQLEYLKEKYRTKRQTTEWINQQDGREEHAYK